VVGAAPSLFPSNMAALLADDHDILSNVLRVSLPGVGVAGGDAAKAAASGTPLVPLPDLAQELITEAAGAPDPAAHWADLAARKSLFDRALVGRLSAGTSAPIIDYLVATYRRNGALRSKKPRVDEALAEILGYVSELCVSYTAIAALNPTMFPQPPAAEQEGVLRLLTALRSDDASTALPEKFLSKLVERMQEDGTLGDFAAPLFDKLAEEAATLSLLNPFAPTYRALLTLVREKPLGAAFAASGKFLPAGVKNGAALERSSLLGPFLAPSCFFPANSRVLSECFTELAQPQARENSFSSLRLALQMVQSALLATAKELLKNSDAKEPLLRLLAAFCTANADRAKQMFPFDEGDRVVRRLRPADPREPAPPESTVSADGTVVNLCAVLLTLCDGFTAPGHPAAAKIDTTYVLSRHRMPLDLEETRLCASPADVAHWLDPADATARTRYAAQEERAAEGESEPLVVSTAFGTVSEYFFLTMRAMHVGYLSSCSVLERLREDRKRVQQQVPVMEQQHQMLQASNPQMAAMMEQQLSSARAVVDDLKRAQLSYEAQLLDPQLLAMATRYYRLVARWLVGEARPPAEGLPLGASVPRRFAVLPMHFMEDVAAFLEHVFKLAPQYAFQQTGVDELRDFVTMMVTFLASPAYVRNPHLRAKFIHFLQQLVPHPDLPEGSRAPNERLTLVFAAHPLAQRHLAPALMNFFVDIEPLDIYVKPQYRAKTMAILDYFWTQPDYRAAIVGFASTTATGEDTNPRFVRFVNMLINDSIYSMDEALEKLIGIKKMQIEMEAPAWQQQPQRTRGEREAAHRQNEGHAGWFMKFCNDVMHMINYLSTDPDVCRTFLLPELCPRMASMLNHFLKQLVGPTCAELKVRDPEKYNFQPKTLLLKICTVLTRFAQHAEFTAAVVKDTRSYNPDNIRKAVRVLARGAAPTMAPQQLEALEAFLSRCESAKQEEVDAEAELGDIPDEFLDPITFEIMEDPVTMPTSGTVIDRPTIARHLLTDETDPFNRAKLTLEMLVPADDLKARILAFRASKRKAIAGASADGGQPMELG